MHIDVKIRAFLDTIAWSEGTSTHLLTKNNGYDVIVSGDEAAGEIGLEIFTTYVDHPFAFGRPAKVIRLTPTRLTSTASGRYQLELKWWEAYKLMLHLSDFSTASQDAVAVRQIQERSALASIEDGQIAEAINNCSNIWASFPGNDYVQPGGKNLTELVDRYQQFLNTTTTT
jgi:muramidase (phage lysozyme)